MVERRTLITVLLVLGMVLPSAAHEVGWILMLPLVKYINGTSQALVDAPLSEWIPHKAYDRKGKSPHQVVFSSEGFAQMDAD